MQGRDIYKMTPVKNMKFLNKPLYKHQTQQKQTKPPFGIDFAHKLSSMMVVLSLPSKDVLNNRFSCLFSNSIYFF